LHVYKKMTILSKSIIKHGPPKKELNSESVQQQQQQEKNRVQANLGQAEAKQNS